MISEINSANNPKVKHIIKLASSSSYRKENREFFLEGLRLCFDAAKSKMKISAVYFTKKAFEKNSENINELVFVSEAAYLISDGVCEKISETKNSQGVFCVCKMLCEKDENDIDSKLKYVALDNVQNPDNLGAISRTAEALGINGLIISGGCDIYNPKAQRASMGSLFRLPVIKTEKLPSLLMSLGSRGMKIYSTTPDSNSKSVVEADFSGGVVAVIGNEANGVSEEVFAVCQKITIPMEGRAESLNAAMAAAITMWEMMRK
ncbi:MAG: RNA methyltransferase [Clostridia bacterium]|nr:RNA methyltransferase [Clostridia bacterium]